MLKDDDKPLNPDLKGKAFDVLYQQLTDDIELFEKQLDSAYKDADITRLSQIDLLLREKKKFRSLMLKTYHDVKNGKHKGFYKTPEDEWEGK